MNVYMLCFSHVDENGTSHHEVHSAYSNEDACYETKKNMREQFPRYTWWSEIWPLHHEPKSVF